MTDIMTDFVDQLRNQPNEDLQQAGKYFAAAMGALSVHLESPSESLVAQINWLLIKGKRCMLAAAERGLASNSVKPEILKIPHLGAVRGADARRDEVQKLTDALRAHLGSVLN